MTRLFPRLAFPDDRLALEVDGRALDYATLARRVTAHARALAERGVSPGDVVGVVAHGYLDTLVAIVGNACAGLVTVPIGPKLGETELAHVLADASPRIVLTAREYLPADRGRMPTMRVEAVGEDEEPTSDVVLRTVDDRDVLLLYTSGTTGAPKGVPLTARNVAANLDGLAAAWAMTDADTVVHALPIFHVHGLVLGAFGPLRFGGGLVHRSRFDPVDLGRALRTGSVLFAVPTMYHRLADAAERDDEVREALRGARLLVSGSAALSPLDQQRLFASTGRHVIERYGATEALIACATPAGAPPRAGSVGPVVPGVTLRLVDDAGEPLAADDPGMGEVAVRGPSVFAGYRNRPEATAEVLVDGWYRTGDLATRDADGWIRIVGRRSTDLLKSGGYRIGAGEIETCLLGHPAVAEVAVIGRPDEDLGERIVAYVVARPDVPVSPDALIAHVGANLSPHKRPREVRFVDALPRNALGKVQKKLLP